MFIVAQSMGSVVTLLMALERPDLIEKLGLVGISGGMEMTQFNAEDCRPDYANELPETAPAWFIDDREDISSSLGLIQVQTLLMRCGDDAISSPVAMGYLSRLIPDIQLLSYLRQATGCLESNLLKRLQQSKPS